MTLVDGRRLLFAVGIRAVGSLKVVLALQEICCLLGQSVRITSILCIPGHELVEIAAEVETIDRMSIKISCNTACKPGS